MKIKRHRNGKSIHENNDTVVYLSLIITSSQDLLAPHWIRTNAAICRLVDHYACIDGC